MRTLLALGLLIAAVVPASRALAHAQLVGADPAAGAVVAEAPPAATLLFSEPVQPLVFRWFPPGGSDVLDAAPKAQGVRVAVPMPPDAARGTWLLSWRVVSADGHPDGGSQSFSVGKETVAGGAPEARATAAFAALGRGLLTLALVFGVGGAVFLRLVERDGSGPVADALARLSAWAALPLAGAAVGLQGLDLIGAGPAALGTGPAWRAALSGTFAPMAALAALSALAALLALRGTRRRNRASATLAWGLAAVSFALFGHAAMAAPRLFTGPAVALHAAAFIFWIGALPGLAERAAHPTAALLATLRRFSSIAVPLVVCLVLSGAGLAAVQLRTPAALIDTAYGRLLLVKLAAVGLLLALAGTNRLRLGPAVLLGMPGAAAALRRSVTAEILLGIVIVGLASGFRLTPPPRAIEAAALEAYVHLHGPTVMADVTLRPGRAGANEAEIDLMTPEGDEVAPLDVRLSFADPVRGIEPIRIDMTRDGGRWRAASVQLPAGGHWVVRAEVLVSDFEKVTLEAETTLPQP